jgi:hypothetical protein
MQSRLVDYVETEDKDIIGDDSESDESGSIIKNVEHLDSNPPERENRFGAADDAF